MLWFLRYRHVWYVCLIMLKEPEGSSFGLAHADIPCDTVSVRRAESPDVTGQQVEAVG